MATRKIVALDMVQKIRKHELEDQAAVLSGLHQAIAKHQAQKDSFLDQLQNQANITSIESAPYVGEFIRSVRAQIAVLDAAISRLEIEAEGLESSVRTKFRDMKTFSTVLDKALEQISLEARRKETRDTDDLTTMRWGREHQNR